MKELNLSKFGKFEVENDKNFKTEIASLYAKVYTAEPWNEDWNVEKACSELEEVIEKEGFTGIVVKRENKVIGFSWGYNVSKENSSRVFFEKIKNELQSKNIPVEKSFYGADTVVDEQYRKQGIGSRLLSERTKLMPKNMHYLCFRTKNPEMVSRYRKAFGEELFSFPEESSYKDGRVYVFRVKNES